LTALKDTPGDGEWLYLCRECNSFLTQTYHIIAEDEDDFPTAPPDGHFHVSHAYVRGWQRTFCDSLIMEPSQPDMRDSYPEIPLKCN